MKEILLSKKSAHRGFHCTIFAAAASTSIRVFRKQFFGVKCGVNFTLDSIIVSGDSFPNDSNNSRPSRLFSIAPRSECAPSTIKSSMKEASRCVFFSLLHATVYRKKNTEKCARATCWSIRGPATHRTVFKYLMWFFFSSPLSHSKSVAHTNEHRWNSRLCGI